MTSISVSIRMVDGSLSEFAADEGFLNKLHALQAQGLRGKQLIHELLSDDWGPPPCVVEIHETLLDGKQIDIRIPYS